MTFQGRHVTLALSLHVLLFGILISGLQCSRKVQPSRVMEAVLYDPSRQQVAQQQRKLEEQKRLAEQQRLEDERRRKQEQEQQQKREQAEQQERQKKQAEAQKRLAAEQQKKEALQKRQAEEKKRKAAEQEKREQAEQERRADEMKSQMQREIEQENLRRQMEQESQALARSELEAKTNEWAMAISRHVQKNWIRPSGVQEEFTCGLQVTLLPDGTVTSAKVTQSCGSPVLDKSIQDAIYRASPIPRPTDPAVFDRNLDFTFTPQ